MFAYSKNMPTEKVQVLVLGSGPAGLCAADVRALDVQALRKQLKKDGVLLKL